MSRKFLTQIFFFRQNNITLQHFSPATAFLKKRRISRPTMYKIYALSDRLKRRNFDALDQWLAYTKGKIRPQSTVKRRVSHRFRISLGRKSQCVGTFSLDVGTLEVPSENFVTSTYLLGAYLTHTDITTQSDGKISYEIGKLRKRTFFGKWSFFFFTYFYFTT